MSEEPTDVCRIGTCDRRLLKKQLAEALHKIVDLMKKHPPFEEYVSLSDGSTVMVTGLYAVEFRKNPEFVRKVIEQEIAARRGARPSIIANVDKK